MILLISYDLDNHEQPEVYRNIKKMIERDSISWAKPLYSQWFVETNEDPEVWSEKIAQIADDNDRWFVVKIQRPYQGWLNKEIWDWLDGRI